MKNYPPTPEGVDPAIAQPSAQFREDVRTVLLNIIFFIALYFLLVVAGFGLAVLCALGGIGLIVLKPMLITLLVGIGLASLGVMVLVFLLKFVFKKSKVDRSHLLEINRAEQPELFAFIEKLTIEIGAPFPKHIYLSGEVNASVFYDSSFWSMFLPIRKNLQIGLGLVNVLTLSEFKAVLAHEFGHFSQRSMKLGSYVYNVNQVIFNLLYDNAGYGRALERWANVSEYFALFMNLTVGIVKGIQWLLQKMYGLINRSYMSLSRQMEFHADAVAAASAGGNQLASALLKLEIAQEAHGLLLQTYNAWIGQGWKASNLYPNHQTVMRQIASELLIPVRNGLPVVDLPAYKRLATSRVVVHDQWASHPSTQDRVERLNQINIQTQPSTVMAWEVILQSDDIQQRMTEKLYENVSFQSSPRVLDARAFEVHYHEEVSRFQLHALYEGYFDNRSVATIDVNKAAVRDARNVADILTAEVVHLPKKINALRNDIQTLEGVAEERSIQSFDLDGHRFPRAEVGAALKQLRNELEKAESDMRFADTRLFTLAMYQASTQGRGEELKTAYINYQIREQQSPQVISFYQDIQAIVAPVFGEQVTLEMAAEVQTKLKELEQRAHIWMAALLQNQSDALTKTDRDLLARYLSVDHTYFDATHGIHKDALDLLLQAVTIVLNGYLYETRHYKKQYLDLQAEWLTV